MLQQALPFGGELYATSAAVEQRQLQFIFQLANGDAHCGLRHRYLRGGGTETAGTGDCNENFEFA